MSDKRDMAKERREADAEAFHEALLAAHEGLTLEQCVRMDVRLILILASRIGDRDLLTTALATARAGAK
ncbi:DUF2783 domain-containing protein [Oricola sp.]|uniref:DUF2783 domain-containing protein n=1 Tax=Oricola sp. TaxID=1979950 RepID=UPI0025E0B000|nr:DUF2783 domain-containing protein [Oricola sp.]MCI5078306.1 DUF2783 domain-containing protein [Oricola sp.]